MRDAGDDRREMRPPKLANLRIGARLLATEGAGTVRPTIDGMWSEKIRGCSCREATRPSDVP